MTNSPPLAEIEAALEKAIENLNARAIRQRRERGDALYLGQADPEISEALNVMRQVHQLLAAARNWQRVVEAGPEVVEVIALAMDDAEDNFATDALDDDNFWRFAARAVLAALREGRDDGR